MIDEKILIERLEEAKERANRHRNYWSEATYRYVLEIVKELAEGCNNNIAIQLAMKYAECLIRFGVDITEKLDTATKNEWALEQAYMRGRQDERDRFAEWQDKQWISVKDQLPTEEGSYLVVGKTGGATVTRWYAPSKFHPQGHFGGNSAEYIRYWMPRPQAPNRPKETED